MNHVATLIAVSKVLKDTPNLLEKKFENLILKTCNFWIRSFPQLV